MSERIPVEYPKPEVEAEWLIGKVGLDKALRLAKSCRDCRDNPRRGEWCKAVRYIEERIANQTPVAAE